MLHVHSISTKSDSSNLKIDFDSLHTQYRTMSSKKLHPMSSNKKKPARDLVEEAVPAGPPRRNKRLRIIPASSSSSSMKPGTNTTISVREVNRLMETQNEDAENKCFTLTHVHVVAIGPNSSGEYTIKLKNGSVVFCAMVTLENEDGTAEFQAKAWGSVMEQITDTNVKKFEAAGEAGQVSILERIDVEFAYECTIKITHWGGRFEAKILNLTAISVEGSP